MSPSTARKTASARRVGPRRATAPAKTASRAAVPTVTPEPPQPAPKPLAKAPEAAKRGANKTDGKKIRGTFVMPEADHALIARLKLSAKRNGLKVKKSELFRLGLRALDALGSSELRDRVLSLRTPSKRSVK